MHSTRSASRSLMSRSRFTPNRAPQSSDAIPRGAALVGACLLLVSGGCTVHIDAADYITACRPGYVRCDGNRVMVCAESGDEFVLAEDCGDAALCQQAQCVSTAPPIGVGDAYVGQRDSSPDSAQDAGAEDGGGDGADADEDEDEDTDRPPTALAIDIRVQFVESIAPGFVDMGFCASPAAIQLPVGAAQSAICANSTFWRLSRTPSGLRVAAYTHDTAQGLVAIAGPFEYDPAEVVALRWVDTEQVNPDTNKRVYRLETIGLLGGEFAVASVELDGGAVSGFGIWNVESTPGASGAVQGVMSAVRIVGSAYGADVTTPLLSELSTSDGNLLQSPLSSDFLSFFTSNAEIGWLILPLDAD